MVMEYVREVSYVGVGNAQEAYVRLRHVYLRIFNRNVEALLEL